MDRPKYDHDLAKRVHEEQLWRELVGRETDSSENVIYHQSQEIEEAPETLSPESLQAAAQAMWDAARYVQPRVEIVSPAEYERRMNK